MSTNEPEELEGNVTDEITQEQQTDAEQTEETPKPAPDKDVPITRFNAYRDSYLREQLGKMQVQEGAETDSALSFLNERAGDEDEGLDTAFRELKVRLRLEERINPKYVDPNPNNGARQRPTTVNRYKAGQSAFERIRHKLGGRL